MALPHTWRPFGARMAVFVFGAGLLVVFVAAGSCSATRRATFTLFQQLHGDLLRAARLGLRLAPWPAAGSPPAGTPLVVVNGYRRRDYEWAQVVDVHAAGAARRGRRWTSRDGTTISRVGDPGVRRRAGASGRCGSCVPWSTAHTPPEPEH